MSNISDLIEQYLKSLISNSPKDFVEVQRSQLAMRFSCVPSQINYVLTTRFSAGHGYLVESRRGGGGYIRIVKIPLDQKVDLILDICDLIGDAISQHEAEGLLGRLVEEELISLREARIMQAAVGRYPQLLEAQTQEQLRAAVLKAMVTAVLRD
ncbi:Transcriptional regulator CtsR [Pelotomaculum schinkii]|uniref:Transcriptional regulator CtsR n=1 Tax=Pelotomaculum schinkii TaxID=78350 RepID=A0A4Y7RHV0_9FIRM|nr:MULTISPECIES: CtsR family transcriptional regulator [Pelotomaculum]TEB08329.1 Transcriptional regulator CtsR [Pelotomaculum schinkii]TEB13244.1 Transcriptional regulator CtsR [Pelotomaculum sp. FP]